MTAWIAVLGSALCIALAGCGGGGSAGDAGQAPALQSAWTASPQNYNTTVAVFAPPAPQVFANQSLRQVMRLAVGGDAVRVRFSNLYGPGPVTLDGAHMARSTGPTTIDTATDTVLTFAGQTALTLAAGEERWSDEVRLSVPAQGDVAVTLFLAQPTAAGTGHTLASQSTGVAAGNQLGSATLAPTAVLPSYFWVSAIDVRNRTWRGTVVAFGDSITDGYASTQDAAQRYPDALSRRVAADPALAGVSVVNAGISGNRVLTEEIGPRGIDRFQRDALGTTGVTQVLVLLGINDIGLATFLPAESVSAAQITAGLQGLVDQAKQRNVKVYLSTLMPYKGSFYYTDDGEAKRQAVNAWVRANTAQATGVFDADAAMRDPADPAALRAAYDSGDHLHPGDAGYQALAAAVNLAWLRP